MASSKELLDLILSGKNADAGYAFDSLVSARVADKIEEIKPEIGAGVFEESEALDEVSNDTKKSYLKKLAGVEKQSKAAGGLYWDNHHPRGEVANAKKKHEKHMDTAKKLVAKGKFDSLRKEETDLEEGDASLTKNAIGKYNRMRDSENDHSDDAERKKRNEKMIAKMRADKMKRVSEETEDLDESKEALEKEIQDKKKAGKFKPYSKLSMRLNFKK